MSQFSDLDRSYSRLRRENAPAAERQAFVHYPERSVAVVYLVAKLVDAEPLLDHRSRWSDEDEFGLINACRILTELAAPERVLPMIALMDHVDDAPLTFLHGALTFGLDRAGQTALEPSMARYERHNNRNHERMLTWLGILAGLGVRDPRIREALKEFFARDPRHAVFLMGEFRDPELVPIMEEHVLGIVRYINEKQINPFAPEVRLSDLVAGDYLDARESLILAQTGLNYRDPEVQAAVEAFDRRVLKCGEVWSHDRESRRRMVEKLFPKVGRNDPCPCGSGRKFKKCHGA